MTIIHCPVCAHVVRAATIDAGFAAIADHIEATHPAPVVAVVQ